MVYGEEKLAWGDVNMCVSLHLQDQSTMKKSKRHKHSQAQQREIVDRFCSEWMWTQTYLFDSCLEASSSIHLSTLKNARDRQRCRGEREKWYNQRLNADDQWGWRVLLKLYADSFCLLLLLVNITDARCSTFSASSCIIYDTKSETLHQRLKARVWRRKKQLSILLLSRHICHINFF